MKKVVYYCYDAYCGWCYGFRPVINKLAIEYADTIEVEVLSGGMIITDKPRHISVTASYIQKAYKTVEELTGVKFGEAYLWHIFNPDESDWYPSSEKPAIALSIFKEYFPLLQVQFASDLQYALHEEGRDLGDDEAYRHLLSKYNLSPEEFYAKLKSQDYKEKAYYEFALVKQLQVTGYPTMLLQASETKFYLLSRGYTDYNSLQQSIQSSLKQIDAAGK
jgi:putative protein-disulfide isomerase